MNDSEKLILLGRALSGEIELEWFDNEDKPPKWKKVLLYNFDNAKSGPVWLAGYLKKDIRIKTDVPLIEDDEAVFLSFFPKHLYLVRDECGGLTTYKTNPFGEFPTKPIIFDLWTTFPKFLSIERSNRAFTIMELLEKHAEAGKGK